MRHFEYADQIAADLVIGIDHLFHAAGGSRNHQFVRQQDCKGFVPDDGARAPDRVTEAERDLLAHGDDVARRRAGCVEDRHILAAFAHGRFQFESDIEMFDDGGLAPSGDEDDLLDPRLARFVDRILDQWPVHDRQQFLRDCLGGGQEAGAQPGNGKDGFADRFA